MISGHEKENHQKDNKIVWDDFDNYDVLKYMDLTNLSQFSMALIVTLEIEVTQT